MVRKPILTRWAPWCYINRMSGAPIPPYDPRSYRAANETTIAILRAMRGK